MYQREGEGFEAVGGVDRMVRLCVVLQLSANMEERALELQDTKTNRKALKQ